MNKWLSLVAMTMMAGSFGFASVACSSTSVTEEPTDEPVEDEDDGNRPVGGSSGSDQGGSSGLKPPGSSSGGGSEACLPTDDYEAGWFNSAEATAGSCTTAQLDAFRAAATGSNPTFVSLRESLGGGDCEACVFTDLGDGTTEIEAIAAIGILTGGANSGAGIVNSGWCAGNKANSPTCGNVYGSWNECIDAVCSDCGTTNEETGQPDAVRTACYQRANAQNSHCTTEHLEAFQEECADLTEALEEECTTKSILDQVVDLCGPTN